ncbi:MAG: IPT/TIG domain-containing protein [Actinobacteria bacterium]|nr:IPT/TIG domain-containing protein [Actinomycetota bacterium]
MKKSAVFLILALLVLLIAPGTLMASNKKSATVGNFSAIDTTPPASTAKLIFIHHSCGQNWLSDSNGGLGIALRDNNYFVSDTNYGWGTDSIGSNTDIGHWYNWFRGPSSGTYTAELYTESGQNSSYSRLGTDPGGENEIIMFKSCYPNSAFQGSVSDPVPPIATNPLKGQSCGSAYHTVSNAKGIYIDLLEYFKTRTDKLFIVIAAPPLRSTTYADNARAFNNWLVNDWLDDYPYNNVYVFDFYNVLTSNGGDANTNDLNQEGGNHHRWWNGAVQHKTDGGANILAYPTGDDHPSSAGNRKATGEFAVLLNYAYNRFKAVFPNITGVSPTTGGAGTAATIDGTGFGDSRGTSYVSFGGTHATQYNQWSDTRIKCLVPAGALSGDLTVTTASGTSNGVDFVVPLPNIESSFYFAEGTTRPGFEEWLCLMNPNSGEAIAQITYMFADGSAPYVKDYPVAADSRFTIDVNNEIGAGKDVSVKVDSNKDIVAERPQYFNYKNAWTGGHDVIGLDAPKNSFYFAEGTTRPGFEEWLCLMNPNAVAAAVDVTYMFGDGSAPEVRSYQVAGNSRYTIDVNSEIGAGKDVSVKVESGSGIVAERPQYFNYKNAWSGGHDVIGLDTPKNSFYFAEGTTRPGFEEWLCLMNPNTNGATARVTYMFGDGSAPYIEDYQLGANSRYTIDVNNEVGTGKDVSVKIDSDLDIIVERPQYFNYKNSWPGGHDVIGLDTPKETFYFAEGTTRPGFEEWLCLMNPNTNALTVDVTYMFADGSAPLVKNYQISALSRFTIDVNNEVGAGKDVSVKVESGSGIVAERPQYFYYKGAWPGGHDVVGFY